LNASEEEQYSTMDVVDTVELRLEAMFFLTFVFISTLEGIFISYSSLETIVCLFLNGNEPVFDGTVAEADENCFLLDDVDVVDAVQTLLSLFIDF
jgi:hypothetical protein